MPELPEIEYVRKQLANAIIGREIVDVQVSGARLRIPLPIDLSQGLRAQIVLSVRRRGKYILIDLSGDAVLVVHLGMSGYFLLRTRSDSGEAHTHVILDLDNSVSIRYNDHRGFGLIALIPSATEVTLPFTFSILRMIPAIPSSRFWIFDASKRLSHHSR
jgi:formamidopyrimidine-DNA glycosylase